jgi:hypothetical protein
MSKQTAVEWLIQNIVEDQTIKAKSMYEWISIFEQAKAMEKEQISKAYEQGSEDGYWHPENGYSNEFESAEQYYNKQFKNK